MLDNGDYGYRWKTPSANWPARNIGTKCPAKRCRGYGSRSWSPEARSGREAVEALEMDDLGPGRRAVPGFCRLAVVSGGVALRIEEEPDDFEGLLRGIAAGLEERRMEGSFDLLELPRAPVLADEVDLLECRIRVCGERVHHSGVVYGWQAEPDVLWRTLAAAARWCLEGADGGTVVLQVGAMAEVVLRDGADVEAYLREAIMSVGEIGLIGLTAIESERFRTVAVEPGNRRVSLIEGGLLLGGDGWRATVVGLTAVLE